MLELLAEDRYMKKLILIVGCVLFVVLVCAAQRENKIQVGSATYNREEPYLKALHAELELGTRVRVTNRINNRKVIVTVTGRIPRDPERIIHIARGAADNIGLSPTGATPVLIEILGAPSN
jgi:rare lipoprotein A